MGIQSWNVYPFASSLLVGRQSLNQRLRSSASPITGTAPFLVLVRLPPKIMAKTLVTLLMLVFVLNLCRTMSLSKKSSDLEDNDGKHQHPYCRHSVPCGWEVYDSLTGTPEYYVANLCHCRPETKCVRHSEHVSISAFVYRCRAPPKPSP